MHVLMVLAQKLHITFASYSIGWYGLDRPGAEKKNTNKKRVNEVSVRNSQGQHNGRSLWRGLGKTEEAREVS